MKQRIESAIDHWHSNTCIRFVVYDIAKHAGFKSRVFFEPINSTTCGSSVGYTKELPINIVYLSDMCTVSNMAEGRTFQSFSFKITYG